MIEKFGEPAKAREAIINKASELGVTPEYLDSLAATSPKAFFTIFGINEQQARVIPGPSRSTVNVSSISQTNKQKDEMEPYRELLAKNRNEYMKPEVQKKIMEQAFEKAQREGRI